MYAYIHIYIYIHTYIHTYIYVHTYQVGGFREFSLNANYLLVIDSFPFGLRVLHYMKNVWGQRLEFFLLNKRRVFPPGNERMVG
jgi:hypothetical protein